MTVAALSTHANRALLALSQPRFLGASELEPLTAVELRELLQALILHGTAPRALNRLADYPPLSPLREPLEQLQARNIGQAFASLNHLARIAKEFKSRNIRWSTLKGLPLAYRYYGDIAARKIGDIDILVPHGQFSHADQALCGLGWRQADHQQHRLSWHERRYVEPNGMTLEVHHRLHPNPHLLECRTTDLMNQLEWVDIAGTAIPTLPPILELLYLCTHGSRHGWCRLIWICDIAAIARQAAPEFIEAIRVQAKRYGLLQPLAQAMLLAEALIGSPAPAWAHTLKERSSKQKRLLAFAEESLWSARDAGGNPVKRTRSSLRNALEQRASARFWFWELLLRIQHEWQQRQGS